MPTDRIVKLDWTKLLAFDQAEREISPAPQTGKPAAKLGAKVGSKPGVKTISRIGAKVGGKVGSKPGPKA